MMALDKLVDSTQLDSDLASVANAIRTKGGTSAQLAFPAGFVSAIGDIPSGGDYTAADFIDPTKPTGNIVCPTAITGGKSYNSKLSYRTGAMTVTLTAATWIPDGFCQNNTGLTLFVADLATEIGSSPFAGATGLTSIAFPSAHTVYSSAFAGASNLLAVDLGGSPSSSQGLIRTNIFQDCSKMATLILRGSTVWPLAYVAAFANTPFASGKAGGTIYIPKSLYDHLGDGTSLDYQSATNWSTIYGYGTITWAKIEGSQYATTYADGRTIPT